MTAKLEHEEIERQTFKAGEYIFREGESGLHFYIIENGQVGIFTTGKTGQKVEITTIYEGESFGEFALLDNRPRSASAQAVTDVAVVKVSQAGYESMVEELPLWATCMMKSMIARLRKMNELLKESDQFLKR
jgi:CRP-like cAMP-binding protein